MCYSARVVQKFEHLSRHYGAEVDWESFREIYMRRADGENIKMSRELDMNYIHPITDTQRLTREYSPANCVGYWDDPRATVDTFDDGWLRTGDLVRT